MRRISSTPDARLAGLLLAAGLIGLAATGSPALAAEPVAVPRPVAAGIWLIAGGLAPDREPDGNTVILETRAGLVVFDTGRHAAQRRAIEAFASSRHVPIIAIVNSHWHLDHVSGNADLKRAYPTVRVYASSAIDGALKGFLARSAAGSRAALTSRTLPTETREDILGDLATVENPVALRPDVVISRPRTLRLGGRTLEVRLAPDAATAGDVWIFDRATGTAVVGDLVTLPAPFLDTACPKGWQVALDQIWATPFDQVIPGHGAPMARAQLAIYRQAFADLIACSGSTRTAKACATDWAETIAPLLSGGPRERAMAEGMSAYYVNDVLRPHGGRSADCQAA